MPGDPLGQPRQRHRIVEVGDGRRWVQNYLPSRGPHAAYQAAVTYAAREAMAGRAPLGGPVRVRIEAWWTLPRSQVRKRTPVPEHPHTKRPDWDNLGKLTSDALTGVVYLDDAQVFDARVVKRTAAQGEPGRLRVTVEAD